MSFNKKEYWKRRKNTYEVLPEGEEKPITILAPMRGQKNLVPEPVLVKESGVRVVRLLGKEFPMTRRARRQRVVNRKYCKKGYRNGIKIKK